MEPIINQSSIPAFPIEIFDLVLSFIVRGSAPGHSHGRLQHLVACALVCKSFKHSAYKQLFDHIRIGFVGKYKEQLDWLMRVVAEEPSLAYYVYELDFDVGGNLRISTELLSELDRYEEGLSGLPNICKISIISEKPRPTSKFPLRLRTFLYRILDRHACAPGESLHSLTLRRMSDIPQSNDLCRALQSLHILLCPLLSFKELFPRLTRLVLRNCWGLDPSTLLQCFPSLKELEFHAQMALSESDEDDAYEHTLKPNFQLTRLIVDVDAYEDMVRFFNLLRDSPNGTHFTSLKGLTDLRISPQEPEDAWTLKDLLHSGLSDLRSLSLDLRSRPGYIADMDLRNCITTFLPSLHHLSFSMYCDQMDAEDTHGTYNRGINEMSALLASISSCNNIKTFRLQLDLEMVQHSPSCSTPVVPQLWREFEAILQCCSRFPQLTSEFIFRFQDFRWPKLTKEQKEVCRETMQHKLAMLELGDMCAMSCRLEQQSDGDTDEVIAITLVVDS
ncbi:hypothetical protein BJ165DRAFT_278244 [Panaeolus papilionaceus]|nr:hypothetical protein BJ165DRAFT_278244 [Panaeolus papilionaceus]